jgi:hypothetical protein
LKLQIPDLSVLSENRDEWPKSIDAFLNLVLMTRGLLSSSKFLDYTKVHYYLSLDMLLILSNLLYDWANNLDFYIEFFVHSAPNSIHIYK